MPALLAGLGLGYSLIIAIGAQNAYVLRQGMTGKHLGLMVAICSLSDAVLIVAGILGVGTATQLWPWLVPVVRWLGATFLIGYAVIAARRALRPQAGGLQPGAEPASGAAAGAVSVALTTMALTWLNPHVYLDTVFLLGSVGASQGAGRWLFALGAFLASVSWFVGLAYGARYLGRWLAGPRAWRYVDGAIAVAMLILGVSLVLH